MRARFYLSSLLLLLNIGFLYATGYSSDIIYINGEKWYLMAKPLNRDSTLYVNLDKYLPENRSRSTANWEGYTAYWSIRNDYLYLDTIGVDLYDKETKEKSSLFLTPKQLKKAFAPYYKKKTICATWMNGEMRAGQGDLVRYVHMGFDRNVEKEIVMQVEHGKIIGQQQYRNFKKPGKDIKEIQKKLETNFPFDRFQALDGQRVIFSLKNIKLSPDGTFIDSDITLFRPAIVDRDSVLKDSLASAIKQELKKIHPWEVLYINGKYTSDYNNWTIPMYPPLLVAHSHTKELSTGDSICYLNAQKDTVIPFGVYTYCGSDKITQIGFVQKQGKIICLNNRGQELFEVFQYDNGPDYPSEGLFRIVDKDGKIGFADTTGHVVITPQFAFAYPFADGKAEVTKEGKPQPIGKDGYSTWKSKNWYYINKEGNIILNKENAISRKCN